MKLSNRVLIFLVALVLPLSNLSSANAMGSGNSYVDAQTGLTYSLYKPVNTLGLTQSKFQLLVCGGGGEQWVYVSFGKSAKKVEIMQTMKGAHCSDPGLSVKLPDVKINGISAKAFVYCDPTQVSAAKKCGQAQVATYGGYLLFTLPGYYGMKATTMQVQVSKGLTYSQLLAVAKSMTPAATKASN
jgi:hypothetical protein